MSKLMHVFRMDDCHAWSFDGDQYDELERAIAEGHATDHGELLEIIDELGRLRLAFEGFDEPQEMRRLAVAMKILSRYSLRPTMFRNADGGACDVIHDAKQVLYHARRLGFSEVSMLKEEK